MAPTKRKSRFLRERLSPKKWLSLKEMATNKGMATTKEEKWFPLNKINCTKGMRLPLKEMVSTKRSNFLQHYLFPLYFSSQFPSIATKLSSSINNYENTREKSFSPASIFMFKNFSLFFFV